jgi:uncharacterized protein YajQ (UPF0234 family)
MPTFDVVSKVDHQEVKNAIQQATKEIAGRFDFKGARLTIEKTEDGISLLGEDEFKLKQAIDVLNQKFVRREVPLRAIHYGKVEPGSGKSVRCLAKIQEGIPTDEARAVVAYVKKTGLKVQCQIMGDQVRVSGKKRDDLQAVIQALKGHDFGIDMKFTNFRD